VAVVPTRLKPEAVQSLLELARSCPLTTTTYAPPTNKGVTELPVAERGSSTGMDPSQPRCPVYVVPRELLENPYIQSLLCDPYLLAIATRYLGVFPVVTKPDMWWDTDFLPPGLSAATVPRRFRMPAVAQARCEPDRDNLGNSVFCLCEGFA
jgi:hypothetical protein